MQSSLTRTAWFFGSCLTLLLSLTAAELRLSVTTVREDMSIHYSFEGVVERVELEDDSIPGLFTSLT